MAESTGLSWRTFWDGDHSIYVNARHRDLHYAGIAADIAALIPDRSAVVLDHGCGEASHAAVVSAACARLLLFDAAPSIQGKLRQRFADAPRIDVLAEADIQGLAERSLDMVMCNSVLQYVGRDMFETLLRLWRAKLKPGAILVVADVIPKGMRATVDVVALLTFATRHGFLPAALRGLAATFFSPYRTLRTQIGLSTYSEPELIAILAGHGFAPVRAARNIGHNQARMTFIATRL